jgi:hypothetical protein
MLGLTGLAATAAVGGLGTLAAATQEEGHGHHHGGSGSADSHVAYVRNVEEVRGHLTSSATLLERGDQEGAALHAGHGSDYFAPVLPPVRDADPELATRLRGRLRAAGERVQSDSASEYERFVTEEVFPLLDEAVAAVVPADERETTAFDAKVLNALAGRIATEYTAAVTPGGEIELSGEYWDGRGFLVRMEERHGSVESELGSTAGDALSALRSEMEAVEAPSTVRSTTLRYRVGATAAADLPGASVEGVEDAVAYARNAEEARGHAFASQQLRSFGDGSAAALHAGHGADYVMALAPPVQAEAPDQAAALQETLLAASARVESDSPSEYEQFVETELVPAVDDAVSLALPDEFAGTTSFDARVAIALLGRIEDEYAAAVTDEEVIELYGEYWDARGFYHRVTQRYDGMKSGLEAETRELIEPELELLGEELRTAVAPFDVANSIAPLTDDFGRAVEK